MANEKQTDSFTWKSRLADLDSLPEEPVDKNAAWEKLHSRLHQKPARTKAAWYWAAACLLLLMVLSFLIVKQSGNTTGPSIVQQKNAPAAPLHVTKVRQLVKEQPVVISIAPVIKVPLLPVAERPGHNNHTGKRKLLLQRLSIAGGRQDIKSVQVVVPADTTVVLVAAAPVKKKLPVVHINELGKQEQENAKFATHTDRSSLRIKWLSQENYPATDLPPANTDRELLKIKIPLKN